MTDLDDLLLKRFLASHGEWKAGLECVYVVDGAATGDPDAPDTRVASSMSEDDADYIAAVHNALPDLIERLKKAEAEVARLHSTLAAKAEFIEHDVAMAKVPRRAGQQPGERGPLYGVPSNAMAYVSGIAKHLRAIPAKVPGPLAIGGRAEKDLAAVRTAVAHAAKVVSRLCMRGPDEGDIHHCKACEVANVLEAEEVY